MKVVGEEGGNEDATPTESEMCESLRKDVRFSECVKEAVGKACEDGGFRQGEDAVSMEDVCVFVDPVCQNMLSKPLTISAAEVSNSAPKPPMLPATTPTV